MEKEKEEKKFFYLKRLLLHENDSFVHIVRNYETRPLLPILKKLAFNDEIIRGVVCKRKTISFGDRDKTYKYSGKVEVANEWTPELADIRDRLLKDWGVRFNYVLVNLYPGKDAAISEHSDDERDLEKDSPIFSLSFGACRRMEFFEKKTKTKALSVPLFNGTLLMMEGKCQTHYLHKIPKGRVNEDGVRINLTFRVLK
jgi:alkylated DNA repair dioxygenase AlkB